MDDSSSSASISSKQSVSADSSYDDQSDSAESEELSNLQRESEMPLEELMQSYDYRNNEHANVIVDEAVVSAKVSVDETVDNDDDDDGTSSSSVCRKRSLFSLFMKSANKSGAEEDDDRDCDYDPIFDIEDFYASREPRIGTEYQADFNDCILANGQLEEDSGRTGNLLWNPYKLNEDIVKKYLLFFYGVYSKKSVKTDYSFDKHLNGESQEHDILLHNPVPDHEHALFQLLMSDFDVDEALRYWNMNPPIYISIAQNCAGNIPPVFDVWSEDEVRLFEWALRLYGKQFHVIQDKSLPGRTVAELVDFYYWWKLTDRYRVVQATKKCSRYVDIVDDEVTYGRRRTGSAAEPIDYCDIPVIQDADGDRLVK